MLRHGDFALPSAARRMRFARDASPRVRQGRHNTILCCVNSVPRMLYGLIMHIFITLKRKSFRTCRNNGVVLEWLHSINTISTITLATVRVVNALSRHFYPKGRIDL